MKKRLLSLLLTFMLVVAMLPMMTSTAEAATAVSDNNLISLDPYNTTAPNNNFKFTIKTTNDCDATEGNCNSSYVEINFEGNKAEKIYLNKDLMHNNNRTKEATFSSNRLPTSAELYLTDGLLGVTGKDYGCEVSVSWGGAVIATVNLYQDSGGYSGYNDFVYNETGANFPKIGNAEIPVNNNITANVNGSNVTSSFKIKAYTNFGYDAYAGRPIEVSNGSISVDNVLSGRALKNSVQIVNTSNQAITIPGMSINLSSAFDKRLEVDSSKFIQDYAGSSVKFKIKAELCLVAGGYRWGDTKTVYSDTITLSKPTYTVNFKANGGSGSMNNQTLYYGNESNRASLAQNTYTKTGYTFAGWNTQSNGSGSSYADKESVLNLTTSSSITLYAQWEPIPYEIDASVVTTGSTEIGGTVSGAGTYNYDTYQTVTATPKTGYSFVNWTEGSTVVSTSQSYRFKVEGARHLVANFTPNQYNLTYVTNGGTYVENTTVTYDNGYILPSPEPKRVGFTFDGWYLENTYINKVDGSTIVKTPRNHSIYAKWNPIQYTINYLDRQSTLTFVEKAYNDQFKLMNQTDFEKLLAQQSITGPANTHFAGWTTVPGGSQNIMYAPNQLITSGLSSIHGAEVNLYAVWVDNAKSHVIYDANGGSGAPTDTTEYWENSTVSVKFTAPTRPGYTFLGWADSGNASTPQYKSGGTTQFTIGNKDKTLYAVWQANTYTVKYHANGGTDAYTSDTFTYDRSKALSSGLTLTRDGYTFKGWAIHENGGVAYAAGLTVLNLTEVANAEIDLYAVWEANPVNVTFVLNAADAHIAINNYTYRYNSAYGMLPTPTREGYTFDGWYLENTYINQVDGSTIVKTADPHSIYAKWTINTYTVTMPTSTTAYAVGYSGTGKVNHGDTVSFTITPAAGYLTDNMSVAVNGYSIAYTGNSGGTYSFTTPPITANSNITVAGIVPQTFTFVLTNGEGYTVVPTLNIVDYDGTLAFTVTVDAKHNNNDPLVYADGVALTPVSQSGNDYAYTVANIKSQVQIDITAVADPTHLVVYLSNGYAYHVESVEDQETATAFVPTREGYTFGGWFTDAAFTNQYDFTAPVGAPLTLYAKWTANTYAVTYAYNVDGATGTVPAAQTKIHDVTLQLSNDIPVREGYSFLGWNTKADGTGVSYDAGAAYIFNEPVTLYAQWQQTVYTVSFYADGDLYDTMLVAYGQTVTLPTTNPTKDGFIFDGWYDGTEEITAATVITSDRSVTAKWSTDTYTVTPAISGTGYTVATSESDNEVPYGGSYSFTITLADGYNADDMVVAVNNIPLVPVLNGGVYECTVTNITEDITITVSGVKQTVYTVSFYADGDLFDTKEVAYGQTVTLPTTNPTKDGFIFDGWYDGTEEITTATVITSDRTVTAQWASASDTAYTVMHYVQQTDGQYDLYTVETKYGTTGTDTAAAAKTITGYTAQAFTQLPIKADGSTVVSIYYDANTDTEYKVEHYLEALDGTYVLKTTDDCNAVTGTIVYAETDNYTGFTYDDTVTGTLTHAAVKADGSLVLKLYYTRNSYDILFKANGGTIDGLAEKTFSFKFEEPVTAPTAVWEGHLFSGWNETVVTTMPAEALTYTAQWDKNAYTVTLPDPQVGYVLTQSDADGSYEYEDVCVLTLSAANGYSIANAAIYINGERLLADEDGKYRFTVTENVTVTVLGVTAKLPVSFDGNGADGGTAPTDSKVYAIGEIITLPDAGFTKTGHIFVGWSTNASEVAGSFGAYTIKASDAQSNPIVFYAIWIKSDHVQYTVKHYQQNETKNGYVLVDTDTQTLWGTTGAHVEATAKTYTGFTYNSAASVTGGTIAADGSLVLELYYDRDVYTVSFVPNDGVVVGTLTEYVYGVGAPLPDAFKTGFTFDGWFTSPDLSGTKVTAITATDVGDKLYYAKWTPNSTTTYTVEHWQEDLYTGGYILVGSDTETIAGITGEYTNASAKIYTGFTVLPFNQERIEADNSTVIKIYYDRNEYLLIFDANGGIDGTSQYVPFEHPITAPDVTRIGWTFAGWATTPNGTAAPVAQTMPAENTIYYAQWTQDKYTILYHPNGGSGSFTQNPFVSDAPILHDGSGFSRAGWTLVGWSMANDGNNAVDFNLGQQLNPQFISSDGVLNLYAVWVQNTVTVSFDANGEADPVTGASDAFVSPETMVYPELGTYQNMPIPQRANYTFVGWFTSPVGGEQIVNGDTLRSGAAHTLYAHWSMDTYTIVYHANGGVEADKTVSYDHNSMPKLEGSIFTRATYDLVGWSTAENGAVDYDLGEQLYTNLAEKGETIHLYAVWGIADVTVNGYTGVYDGMDHDITYALANPITVLSYQWYFKPAGTTAFIPVADTDADPTTYPVRDVAESGEYYCHIEGLEDNYYVISFDTKVCEVSITKRSITFTAGSTEKIYDGHYQTFAEYAVNDFDSINHVGLCIGHTHAAQMTAASTIKNVGQIANEIDISTVRIFDEAGTDVTVNYAVSTKTGILKVIPRNVALLPVNSVLDVLYGTDCSELYDMLPSRYIVSGETPLGYGDTMSDLGLSFEYSVDGVTYMPLSDATLTAIYQGDMQTFYIRPIENAGNYVQINADASVITANVVKTTLWAKVTWYGSSSYTNRIALTFYNASYDMETQEWIVDESRPITLPNGIVPEYEIRDYQTGAVLRTGKMFLIGNFYWTSFSPIYVQSQVFFAADGYLIRSY